MVREQLLGEKAEEIQNFKNKLKLTLSGISGAFMFPIATLAITCLFLALGGFVESAGARISSQAVAKAVQFLGSALKAIAFPILKALPLLFCVAFTIAFCNSDTTCIWASIISYLAFISVQNAFIWPDRASLNSLSSSGTSSSSFSIDNVRIPGYVVLFPGLGRDPKWMVSLVDRTLGITSLNTSIFGALVIGGICIPYIKKHYFDVTLPGSLSFFSGKRFVPLVAVLLGAGTAIIFLIFWPWAGIVFSWLGNVIGKTPGGIDSFIFGVLEKSLIPFGLHHMFYAPLWYTSLGGDVISRLNETVSCGDIESLTLNGTTGSTSTTTSCAANTASGAKLAQEVLKPISAAGFLWDLYSGARAPHSMWHGDSFIGASAISLPSDMVTFKNGSSGSSTTSPLPVMKFLADKLNIKVGRFTQGKYPVMQFGLPAAGIAMILAAPKENRKEATTVLVPAMTSSFLMGITEPMEFSFLFLAPKLFYGFHAVLCGVSFMAMNLLGAHMPCIFSGGVIEAAILGIIPFLKGTEFWWYIVVGFCLAPVYFAGFSAAIRYWDLATPGRTAAGSSSTVKVTTTTSKVPEKTRKLAVAFGGWDNISKMSNCASRLRYDIVDKSKVDEVALKGAGAIAVKWVGDNHIQVIVGPQAENINNEMIKWNGEDLG